MNIKRALALIMMIAVCIMFFILIFIEMGETRAYHLNDQDSGLDKELISGVLDRFEKNQAVILIEDLNKQITTPKQLLPEGSKENMWFYIKKEDGEFEIVSIDYEKTESERKKAQNLLKKLRE